METPTLIVSDSLNNSLFHSSPQISQTLHQILHSELHSGLTAELRPRFCSLGLRSGLFGGHESESSYGDHDLLDYCTFRLQAENGAQFVRVDTACGKDHDQQILSKAIMWIATFITEALPMSKDTNNPVCKFTTDNLQLNVLIRSIFEP